MSNYLKMISILLFTTKLISCNTHNKNNFREIGLQQYRQCIRFYNNKDTNNYIKFVHPNIRLTNQKYFFDSIKHKVNTDSLSDLFINDSIFQFSFVEKSNSNLIGNYVIAISYNYGKNWYFFNVFNTLKNMRILIPNLDYRLPVKLKQNPDFMF